MGKSTKVAVTNDEAFPVQIAGRMVLPGQTIYVPWDQLPPEWRSPTPPAGADTAESYVLPDHTLASHSDVADTAPASGEVLKWNGTQWAPAVDASGGGSAVTSVAGKTGAVSLVAGDVAGVEVAGAGALAVSVHAGASNAHGIGGVTGLQTALDAKAAASHTHTGTVTVFSGSVLPVPSAVPGNGYIVNGRLRFSDGATWIKLSPPMYEIPWMYVPLRTTLEPVIGNNVSTYTRAGTDTLVDFEGLTRTVEANELPINGARHVKNLLAQTESAVTNSLTVEAGTYIYSLQPCSGSVAFTGAVTGTPTLTGSLDGAKQIILTTTAGTLTMTVSGTVGRAQLEKTTGQAKQVASEHISRGVESAPYYHGTGVDGSRYFDTVNGNSINGSGFLVYAEGGEIATPIAAKVEGSASLTFTGNGSDWSGIGIGTDSNGNVCVVGVEYP